MATKQDLGGQYMPISNGNGTPIPTASQYELQDFNGGQTPASLAVPVIVEIKHSATDFEDKPNNTGGLIVHDGFLKFIFRKEVP